MQYNNVGRPLAENMDSIVYVQKDKHKCPVMDSDTFNHHHYIALVLTASIKSNKWGSYENIYESGKRSHLEFMYVLHPSCESA